MGAPAWPTSSFSAPTNGHPIPKWFASEPTPHCPATPVSIPMDQTPGSPFPPAPTRASVPKVRPVLAGISPTMKETAA